MSQAYRISYHAAQRIESRRFTVEELLAALEGRQVRLADGLVVHFDPISRVALVIDPAKGTVVTALRLKRGKYGRICSSNRQQKGT